MKQGLARVALAIGIVFFGHSDCTYSKTEPAKDRSIALQFVPQETLSAAAPTSVEAIALRSVSLVFEDERPSTEIAVVGQGTEDNDSLFSWRPTTPAFEFVKQTFTRIVQEWGVKFEDKAELVLNVNLTKFFVTEKDQAVGSNYTGDVNLVFKLKDRESTVLSSGTATGSARRYGRKRSADNCNEVLSDATKEAASNLLSQPGLQSAWGGKNTNGKAPAKSSSALLADLIGLKSQGVSTELMIRFINQQVLSAPLSAQDILEWKKAGLPESVIQAAMDRVPSE